MRDVVEVLPRLVAEPACHGRIFNVGSDRPITIRSLAELVVRSLGSSSRIRTIPYGEAFPAGFEDLRQRQPDLTRLRSAVPFSPSISLEQTIESVARFIREARP